MKTLMPDNRPTRRASKKEILILERRLLRESRALIQDRENIDEDVLERRLDEIKALRFGIVTLTSDRESRAPAWTKPNMWIISFLIIFSGIGIVALRIKSDCANVYLACRVDGLWLTPPCNGKASHDMIIPLSIPIEGFRMEGVSHVVVDGIEAEVDLFRSTVRTQLDEQVKDLSNDFEIQSISIPAQYEFGISLVENEMRIKIRIQDQHDSRHLAKCGTAAAECSIPSDLDGLPNVQIVINSPGGLIFKTITISELYGDISENQIEVSGEESSRLDIFGKPSMSKDLLFRFDIDQSKIDALGVIQLGSKTLKTVKMQLYNLADNVSDPQFYTLEGRVELPEIELPSHSFGFRQDFRIGEATGEIHRLALILPGSKSVADIEAYEEYGTHLRLDWTGSARSLSISNQPIMPPLLFSWIGSKTKLYISGIIIYAGIFAYSLLQSTKPGVVDIVQPTELL